MAFHLFLLLLQDSKTKHQLSRRPNQHAEEEEVAEEDVREIVEEGNLIKECLILSLVEEDLAASAVC